MKLSSMRRGKRQILTIFFMVSISIGLISASKSEADDSGITYEVVESAQLNKICFYMGKWKKQSAVIFEVGVKNISQSPKRFKLIIDIPEGSSASCLYPRTGNPPVIEPGAEFMHPVPVFIQEYLPKSFSIIVVDITN